MAKVTHCRSCGSSELVSFLSLGRMPIINNLITDLDVDEPRYPLEVAFCKRCTLVQLTEELPAEVIFNADYPYYSSYADALLEHSRRHVEKLIAERNLGPTSQVVELASNDGYLLQYFKAAGVPVLGVDPAPGPARVAQEKGIPTLVEFFNPKLANRLVAKGIQADVILANNVLAHIPDLNGFVEGIAILLKETGIATIENPYVRDLVEQRQFDTIYHEHYCYHSVTGINNLMKRHGLTLFRVEHYPIHGGSLRYHVGKNVTVEPSVHAYLEEEHRIGMDRPEYYLEFGSRAAAVREALLALLAELRAQGKRIAAYGAAAKGAIMLNYAGIGPEIIQFVADRNPHKQGKYLPGVRIPISPPERILEEQPDYLLVLIWNLKDEVMRQQAEFARRGGKFIVAIPYPEILQGESEFVSR